MADFDRPASEALQQNNAELTPAQTSVADGAIKNFLKGVKFPPTTQGDRDKMKAAIQAFRTQIKKTKEAAAKKAGTVGKTGKAAAVKTLATQNADKVGNSVPDIKRFLPAGTDPSNVSFDAVINSLEAAVTRLDALSKEPPSNTPAPPAAQATQQVQSVSTTGLIAAAAQAAAAAAALIKPKQTIGGGVKETDAVNVRDK